MSVLDALLNDLARGSLSLEQASAQLAAATRNDPQLAASAPHELALALATKRISAETATSLRAALDALERTAVLGDSHTLRHDIAPGDAGTLVRPLSAANLDQRTMIRPAPSPAGDVDQRTLVRTADDLQRSGGLPVQDVDSGTLVRPRHDSPLAEDRRVDDGRTLIRPSPIATDPTLRSPLAAPYENDTREPVRPDIAPTSVTERLAGPGDTREHTLVLNSRRVQYLGDAPEAGPRPGPVRPGAVLKNRFLLETLIGKGGMGLVFSAVDRRKEEARDPNPRVALKVLSADFQRHPQAFMALQREARKAQTLAHPNVVTVFDFDRDYDTVFMTMDLLKGRSLDAVVREVRGKGVGREVALPIIRGIAEGLAYAHRKGIVHSDLKPGNVFVIEDGTPKILDFGIARAVPNASSTEIPDEFDAGSLGAYTEAYATDEMVEGVDPHPADDMYALGIIGYELLTGQHPYQRMSASAARAAHLKPPALKGLKMREAKALERCLSFDRRLRPRDAGEFLKAFRGVTMLQKSLVAATAVLVLVSGYLWYQNYRDAGPSIPFSQLPAETRANFTKLMSDGDRAWQFYERDHNPDALNSAVEQYADAYRLHPRNREAVKALRKVADAFLVVAGDSIDNRKAVANFLQQQSDYYRRYDPVIEAAQ